MPNDHFVPQFYFRKFSKNGPRISVVQLRTGRVVTDAPIRSQCAPKNFYGMKGKRDPLQDVENAHSLGISAFLDFVWSGSKGDFDDVALERVLESILLQRARTRHQAQKVTAAHLPMVLMLFREYLAGRKHYDGVAAIDAGKVTVKEAEYVTAWRNISVAMRFLPDLAELDFHVLKNFTDIPFIFSDAPVVFVNTHLRKQKQRGTLGLNSPGIQIFYPLDPTTLIMLCDDSVYSGTIRSGAVVNLVERRDISNLNALQLHHGLECAYFGNPADATYVEELFKAHQKTIKFVPSELRHLSSIERGGETVHGNWAQILEPQINFVPSFTFMSSRN